MLYWHTVISNTKTNIQTPHCIRLRWLAHIYTCAIQRERFRSLDFNASYTHSARSVKTAPSKTCACVWECMNVHRLLCSSRTMHWRWCTWRHAHAERVDKSWAFFLLSTAKVCELLSLSGFHAELEPQSTRKPEPNSLSYTLSVRLLLKTKFVVLLHTVSVLYALARLVSVCMLRLDTREASSTVAERQLQLRLLVVEKVSLSKGYSRRHALTFSESTFW